MIKHFCYETKVVKNQAYDKTKPSNFSVRLLKNNMKKNYNLTENRQVQLICNACTHLGE